MSNYKESIKNYLIDSMGYSTHDLISLSLDQLLEMVDDEDNMKKYITGEKK